MLSVLHGDHEILVHGYPGPGFDEFVRVVQDRYHVRVRRIADCEVTDSLTRYASAYNAVSIWALKGEFGRDIVEETHREINSLWAREHLSR